MKTETGTPVALSEHVTAYLRASREKDAAAKLIKDILSAPQTSHLYLYGEDVVQISMTLPDAKTIPADAEPSLSGSAPTLGTIKLSWTWTPHESIRITATTSHPASEAYRILAEYAEREEARKEAEAA
jgi:hypothetical protein